MAKPSPGEPHLPPPVEVVTNDDGLIAPSAAADHLASASNNVQVVTVTPPRRSASGLEAAAAESNLPATARNLALKSQVVTKFALGSASASASAPAQHPDASNKATLTSTGDTSSVSSGAFKLPVASTTHRDSMFKCADQDLAYDGYMLPSAAAAAAAASAPQANAVPEDKPATQEEDLDPLKVADSNLDVVTEGLASAHPTSAAASGTHPTAAAANHLASTTNIEPDVLNSVAAACKMGVTAADIQGFEQPGPFCLALMHAIESARGLMIVLPDLEMSTKPDAHFLETRVGRELILGNCVTDLMHLVRVTVRASQSLEGGKIKRDWKEFLITELNMVVESFYKQRPGRSGRRSLREVFFSVLAPTATEKEMLVGIAHVSALLGFGEDLGYFLKSALGGKPFAQGKDLRRPIYGMNI